MKLCRLVLIAFVVTVIYCLALLATGCSGDEVLRFGWPVGVTDQAIKMRWLWTWSVIAALAVGVIVWGLIFWASAFHRKKKNSDPTELPRQFQYNVPLELFCVVLPLVIVRQRYRMCAPNPSSTHPSGRRRAHRCPASSPRRGSSRF